MRKVLLIFLVGVVVGASIFVAFILIQLKTEEENARATLDWLIDEWSAEREISIAGFPAKVELPDARPRYFPERVRPLAKRLDSLYHIPAEVTLAQWALESRWGMSNLGVSNYFGHTYAAVKPYMRDPQFILVRETVTRLGTITKGDTVRFAKYKDIADCFDTHGRYLSQSGAYKAAFQALAKTGSRGFAREMAKRYATDPDYGLKLLTIIHRYQL